MQLDFHKLQEFSCTVWSFYSQYGRSFSWRHVNDPYKVVISEIMLQQTQTFRVAKKYEQFILEFPSFHALASADLRYVLSLWQGLGYNRRCLYLHQLAKKVVELYDGNLPSNSRDLIALPGIGKATAASIAAFAFNQPTAFIETNIRAVFIYCFFQNRSNIDDKEIMPLVEATVDQFNPREWYYALMDYGVMLKKIYKNPSRKSKHHTAQSAFEGSDRQVRGVIIKVLTEYPRLTRDQLKQIISDDRVDYIIEKLSKEGMVKQSENHIFIP